MRAEQWMMLGVGAVGLYAVYRLTMTESGTRTEPARFPTTPTPQPLPGPLPIPIPSGPLPALAGEPGTPPQDIVLIQGDPLHLRGGAWYKGRIETAPNLELTPFRSDAEIAAFLTSALGLGQVEVYRTPQAAAGSLGQAFVLENAGQGTRWFRGRLPALGNTDVPRPYWLKVLWLAAPPVPAAISGYHAQGWSY